MNLLENNNFEVSSPGLFDPGVIIMGKVGAVNSGSWPVGGAESIPLPEFEFKTEGEDGMPILIQYRANTNKFLGIIGDFAEYGFKHIPEKFYYNNISILELLTESDQKFLGTNITTYETILKSAVFTELIGSDYEDSSSIPQSLYDKFKPKYFGTVMQEDRTVMVFLVPPEYNTVFISNGPDVYSKDDYFNKYGNLLGDWFQEQYAEMANIPRNVSLKAVQGNSTNTISLDYTPSVNYSSITGPIIQITANSVSENINSDTDPNPEPNTGGRGRNTGSGSISNSAVSVVGEGYSLVTDLEQGLSIVVPGSQEASMDPDIIDLYDYWFPSSSYEFKEFNNENYPLYIRFKSPLKTYWTYAPINKSMIRNVQLQFLDLIDEYRWIKSNSTPSEFTTVTEIPELPSTRYKEGDSIKYKNSFLECIRCFSLRVFIRIGETYKDAGQISYYTEAGDATQGGKIYKKVKNFPSKRDILSDRQIVLSKYGSPREIIYYPFQSEISYEWEKLTNYMTTEAKPVFYELPSDVEGLTNNEIIFSVKDNCYYKYKTLSTPVKWYIKEYKTASTGDDGTITPGNSRPGGNIDIDTNPYIENQEWNSKYGNANYYKYLSDVCQTKIVFGNGADLGYYKLVKIIISPRETQEYELVGSTNGNYPTPITLEEPFILGDEIYTIIKEWINYTGEKNSIEVSSIPPTDQFPLRTVIKCNNSKYILDLKLSKTSGNIEEIEKVFNAGKSLRYTEGSLAYFYQINSKSKLGEIESINVVNLGYNTSDNPLRNVDKYLVRGDQQQVKKYIKTDSGILDLTSRTYVSSGIRKTNEEDKVDFLKYSYRREYRKGQRTLIGLEDISLFPNIVDIQQIVPSIYTNVIESVGGNSTTKIDTSLIGSIVYDYSEGEVYGIEKDGSDSAKIGINYTEKPRPYLYRYRGEYYLMKDSILQRASYSNVRTWVSLEDNNRGNIPGISRQWMSRDGSLSIGDKVWIMLISENIQKKILGEVIKYTDTDTGTIGVGIRIVDEPIKFAQLNGVTVNVNDHDGATIEHLGVKKCIYDLFLIYKGSVADITKNIVFKDKINYLVKINYEV